MRLIPALFLADIALLFSGCQKYRGEIIIALPPSASASPTPSLDGDREGPEIFAALLRSSALWQRGISPLVRVQALDPADPLQWRDDHVETTFARTWRDDTGQSFCAINASFRAIPRDEADFTLHAMGVALNYYLCSYYNPNDPAALAAWDATNARLVADLSSLRAKSPPAALITRLDQEIKSPSPATTPLAPKSPRPSVWSVVLK